MKYKQFPLIRHRSAKDILRIDKDIGFRAVDNFSVFDVGRSEDKILGKAKAIIACAVKSFMIAQEIGVPTHFVEQIDDVTIRVLEAQIIKDRSLTPVDDNYVLPIEFIYRLRSAGSIERDFKSGKKKPEDYGLPSGQIPPTGTPFPAPVHHPTTKFEETDRDLTIKAERCAMSGITEKDEDEFWSIEDRLAGACSLEMSRAGYAMLDGKMEFLLMSGRLKMVGDVFFTPDEDRPVPIDELVKGKVEHYSKEYIRQHFIDTGYFDALQAARDAGLSDLPLPRLPKEVIEEVSRRYIAVAEAYSGTRITID